MYEGWIGLETRAPADCARNALKTRTYPLKRAGERRRRRLNLSLKSIGPQVRKQYTPARKAASRKYRQLAGLEARAGATDNTDTTDKTDTLAIHPCHPCNLWLPHPRLSMLGGEQDGVVVAVGAAPDGGGAHEGAVLGQAAALTIGVARTPNGVDAVAVDAHQRL